MRSTIRFASLLASCLLMGMTLHPALADALLDFDMATALPMETAFTDPQGNTHTLEKEKGKLTAVHFWASWCVPCVAELPEVDAAQAAYGEKGFKVIAISLDTNMDKVTQFYAAHNITHLQPWLDISSKAFQAAAFSGLPGTLFLDAEGKPLARVIGPLNWQSEKTKGFIEAHLK